MKKILHIIVCLFALLIISNELLAQEILVEKTDTSKVTGSKVVAIPFSFYLKTLGVSAAVDIAARGLLQQQSTSTLVGLVSTNGSKYIYWEAENFQVPMVKRLFFSPNINIAHYGALDVYNGLNLKFPTETAGNNYSDKMNYYRIQSNKIEGEFIFRFLLPTGYGEKHVLDSLYLMNGLPIDHGTSFGTLNPFTSGRTFIESSLFFQDQKMQFEMPIGNRKLRTFGYTVGISNENVDFKDNPSRGTMGYFKFWNGISAFNSTSTWTMYEGSMSAFVPMHSTHLRQQVLAFNVWSRYTNRWNDYEIDDNRLVYLHHPSPFMGACLGGRFHFRGYPEARYNDCAAWLYSLEYRMIPQWNPLRNWKLLEWLNVKTDWIQFVAFAESGRVAPNWSLKTFHQNMKYDAGAGIRIFANQMTIRVDSAFSPEGPQLQMFINQAF